MFDTAVGICQEYNFALIHANGEGAPRGPRTELPVLHGTEPRSNPEKKKKKHPCHSSLREYNTKIDEILTSKSESIAFPADACCTASNAFLFSTRISSNVPSSARALSFTVDSNAPHTSFAVLFTRKRLRGRDQCAGALAISFAATRACALRCCSRQADRLRTYFDQITLYYTHQKRGGR